MVTTVVGQIRIDPGSGNEPAFVISVAARMVGVHAQTLRTYERVGLIEPARSQGNIRLYSARDVQRALRIRSLIEDLGMNLAGAEVIMRMSSRIAELEQENSRLRRIVAQAVEQDPRTGIRSRRT